MSKQEADILLIRKYLNGELDARAMHHLERRAQDDPFLMDAIEGYENIKTDQRKNLDELAASLQQRITRKEARTIPWRALSIAASILIVFTVGGLLFFKNRSVESMKMAQLQKPEFKSSRVPPPDDSIVRDNVIASTPAQAKRYQPEQKKSNPVIMADKVATVAPAKPAPLASTEMSAEEPNADTDSTNTSLAEMVVVDMTKKKKDTARNNVIAMQDGKIFRQPNVNTVLQGKVAGVMATPADGKALYGYFGTNLRRKVEGMIIDKVDGSPLPGVSVRVAGTNTATLTDASGHFKLPMDSNRTNLNIGFIGYESQNVNINKRDSLKTIAMVPSSKSLSEVVVVGYGTKKVDDDIAVVAAHPIKGWGSLRKYLKENAKSPDGKTGTVKLFFIVDHDGGISDITVVKGISPATNKKATDLLSDGPKWLGNSNGQTEKVTIRITFTK